ncbi:MAG: hypothetical protein ACE5GE_01980 [Phycisphaerae bacterium]
MSTLTKIFVVLLAVFSIAFTMSTISFVAQSNNWRELAQGYQTEAQATDAQLRNVLASSAAEVASARDAINAHIARFKAVEADYQSALQQIADLKAQLAQTQATNASLQSTSRLLAGELKVGQAGWTEQRKQRDDLEQRNLSLEKRNIDLSDRVNEQTAKLLVMQKYQRQLEEQSKILQDENQRLGQIRRRLEKGDVSALADAGRPQVKPLSPVASSPIRGEITQVSGKLATLSVGSADGVANGMVFVIYRGLDYVGDLEIVRVEPNESAGRIVRSRGAPRIGDKIADEARFGMAN